MTPIAPAVPRSLTVLTVNIHKGFDLFNRRFVLKDLRDAVRSESADVVFLQEVQGSHELHATRFVDWGERQLAAPTLGTHPLCHGLQRDDRPTRMHYRRSPVDRYHFR